MLNRKSFMGLLLGTIVMCSANAGETTKKSQIIEDGGKRLQSRKITGVFKMSGTGGDSNWGIKGECNFTYSVATEIISRIVKKDVQANGYINVVEERTFVSYIDSLDLNPSAKFDFSTLPVNEFLTCTRALGWIGSIIGRPDVTIAVEGLATGTHVLIAKLDKKDIPIPEKYKKLVMKTILARTEKKFLKNRPVVGKTYRLTYTQNRKGRPMKVKFTNVDGSNLSKEEETILKKVNAFVDYNVLPDPNKRIGGFWTIDAQDLQNLFDPYLGTVWGKVDFIRIANDKDNNWNIKMQPADLTIRNDNYKKIGTLELLSGNATVVPKQLHNVLNMSAKGRVKTEIEDVHHILFTAKVSNWCEWEGRVVSEIIK